MRIDLAFVFATTLSLLAHMSGFELGSHAKIAF